MRQFVESFGLMFMQNSALKPAPTIFIQKWGPLLSCKCVGTNMKFRKFFGDLNQFNAIVLVSALFWSILIFFCYLQLCLWLLICYNEGIIDLILTVYSPESLDFSGCSFFWRSLHIFFFWCQWEIKWIGFQSRISSNWNDNLSGSMRKFFNLHWSEKLVFEYFSAFLLAILFVLCFVWLARECYWSYISSNGAICYCWDRSMGCFWFDDFDTVFSLNIWICFACFYFCFY